MSGQTINGAGRLGGRVALITGAGRGIGAATALRLAVDGASVAVADIDMAEAQAVADSIIASGGRAIAVQADIGSEDQIAAMTARAIEAFGRIDVLHNNAAITSPAHMARDRAVTDLDADDWDRTMAVNLRGPMLCCKHVIPHMVAGGGGSIINTSSGKALQGDLAHTAYGVSKVGLIGLTRYVAAQYGKQGVRANVLVVGVVLKGDDLAGVNLSPQRAAQLVRYKQHHLTRELGSPRNVADAVAFLASDEAAFITGAELAVDGGFTSHSPLMADQLASR